MPGRGNGRRAFRKGRKGGRRGRTAHIEPSATATSAALPSRIADTHRFVRSVEPVNLSKTGSDFSAAYSFSLADCPGASDFTSLFDSYFLDLVELTFRLEEQNPGDNVTLYVAADYDGGLSSPSLSTVLQYRHVEVTLTATRPSFTFRLRPMVSSSLLAPTGVTSAGLTRCFVDLASDTVSWYGAVVVAKNYNTTTTNAILTKSGTYHFRCRTLR